MENNTDVEIMLVDGQVIIKGLSSHAWTLEELLSGVTRENLHREIDSGDAVGNEAW